MKKILFTFFLMVSLTNTVLSQEAEKKIVTTVWDGIVIVGYVDNGGFINFGGPSIKLISKPYAIGLGVLPSLKIKEDKVAAGQTKNAIFTPTLGAGITFIYKHLVIQTPIYYTGKNAKSDGKWNIGIGIGYKF